MRRLFPFSRRPVPPQIDRYIAAQLALGVGAVTFGLVTLVWLTQSLRFIQLIVGRGLSPLVFLKLTLLLVPSFVAVILPLTCFIVVIFVYGRLAGDRELTVMRAAGLSDFALARPALALATLVMLVCYWLNLAVVPATLAGFRTYQFEIRNQIAAFLLEPGVFTALSPDLVVYVQTRRPDDSLAGILIEDSRDKAEPATILARSGQLVVTPAGPEVLLKNGSREQVNAKTGWLDVLTFEQDTVNLASIGKSTQMAPRDATEAPLADLFDPADAGVSPEDWAHWIAEGHKRLSSPLFTLSFALVGLLAMLGGQFRRHGGLMRPLGAVIGVTCLMALSLGAGSLAAKSTDFLPLIWIVTVLPGIAAAAALFGRDAARLPRRAGPAGGSGAGGGAGPGTGPTPEAGTP